MPFALESELVLDRGEEMKIGAQSFTPGDFSFSSSHLSQLCEENVTDKEKPTRKGRG